MAAQVVIRAEEERPFLFGPIIGVHTRAFRIPRTATTHSHSSRDLLFFNTGDGRRMTAKSKTKDLAFETQNCPAGWTVQVGHAVVARVGLIRRPPVLYDASYVHRSMYVEPLRTTPKHVVYA